MYLDYTDEQLALRKELREYFDRLLTPEVRAGMGHPGEGNPLFRTIVRQMGVDGWLGIGWPIEYGGQGRSTLDQFIFFDEVQRANAPFPFVTVNTVGPAIMANGTEEQKQRYLPGILAGEVDFADGFHEARGRDRPGVAADARDPRWRRVGHQRQQGLHERRQPSRLHLARVSHRSGCA